MFDLDKDLRVLSYSHIVHANELKRFDCLLKKDIIELGFIKDWCKIRYAIKYNLDELVLYDKDGEVRIPELDYKTAIALKLKYDNNYLRVVENLRKAYFKRRKLLSNRIKFMLECGNCWFCTLTFSNEFINKKKETIRSYYKKWLKDCGDVLYIGNIDFGKRTQRMHYHFIVCSDNPLAVWTKGFYNFKKIHVKNVDALAKYVSKLTMHSLKMSNASHTVIYSKKFKEIGV